MASSKDKDKIALERDLISLLLQYKDIVSDWTDQGPAIDYFDDSHHMLLYAITGAANQDSKLTLLGFRTFLRDNGLSKVEVLAHETEYQLCNASYVVKDDFVVLRTKIVEAYISRISIRSIERFRDDLTDKGAIFAVKQLAASVGNLAASSDIRKPVDYNSIIDYIPEFTDMLRNRRDGKGHEVITCGIKEIDYAMMVGFAPGTLALFCGDVGAYKSTMMMNVGLNIWAKAKKNVLFVPLEMPKDKMMERILSRELKIPFEKFEDTQQLTPDDWKGIEQFENERREWPHKFYIMDAPERIPVSLIRSEIEKHVELFKPDVVVVDYIANLIPDERYKKERPDLQIGEMLKDLRHMGRPNSVTKSGFAVVSGAQIGREGLKRMRKLGGKATFFSEDLRGSHEYSADADFIFGQLQDPAHPNNCLFLVVIKSRYGRKVFSDGQTKVALDVIPEMGLIRSKDAAWLADEKQQVGILAKVNDEVNDWSAVLGSDKEEDIPLNDLASIGL